MTDPTKAGNAATVADGDAMAAYLEMIQKVLCSPRMDERERNNAVASLAHRALLNHGGGYDVAAVAARERTWKAIAHAR